MENMIWLNRMSEEDIDTVFALTSDAAVAQYMRFSTHHSREEAEELVKEYLQDCNYAYMIRFISGDTVGVAVLKKEPAESAVCSMSVYSFPRYWNKGFGTAVVEELKKAAAANGIKLLRAYVVEQNAGSKKALEKCGFQLEKVLSFDDSQSKLHIYAFHL